MGLKRETWRGLKCLPLDWWMTSEWMRQDVLTNRRFTRELPVIHVPGRYYSRSTGMSWFEVDGEAWCDSNPESFLYDLSVADDKRVTKREIEALHTIVNLTTDRGLKRLCIERIGQHEWSADRRRMLVEIALSSALFAKGEDL